VNKKRPPSIDGGFFYDVIRNWVWTW